VFYFCKVEVTIVHNGEKYKQIVAFDKVHVLDKPVSAFDVEHLVAYLVVFLAIGGVVYGLYTLLLKRYVKKLWNGNNGRSGKTEKTQGCIFLHIYQRV